MRGIDLSTVIFQQDGAPAHSHRVVKKFLQETFGNNVIGLGHQVPWPPRTPDLTAPDFFLWGCIKNQLYNTKVKDLADLKTRITRQIRKISPETLRKVHGNINKR
ncbi:uncharacterized protein B4U80_02349, partial [Leptotrombidium deliense]